MEKAYTRTNWVDDTSPLIDAEHLNNIESGIDTIDDRVVSMDGKVTEAYDNAGSALSGISAIQATYATKSELAEVSETVTEIATEVSEGKADVILANASGTLIHVEDSSESNSVEFKLIGASGSVEVKSLGKNIFNPAWIPTQTQNGVTCTNNGDNTWTFSGSETDDSLSYGFFKRFNKETTPIQFKKVGYYRLSVSGISLDASSQYFYMSLYYNGVVHYNVLNNTQSLTMQITEEMLAYDDFSVEALGFYVTGTRTSKLGTIGVQIEYGETATEFEPYKESTTTINADESTEAEVKLFYPVTNILNDANCGMEVTYKADTKNYIDKIIGERISAIETALINNI